MATAKRFEDLDIWKAANQVAVRFYEISETEKLKNDWGLKDQVRRAAVSISNNIAEGFEYDNNKDFIRFLRYAKGSAGEVRNQLIILRKVNYVDESFFEEMNSQLIQLSKQIAGLISYLKKFEQEKPAIKKL